MSGLTEVAQVGHWRRLDWCPSVCGVPTTRRVRSSRRRQWSPPQAAPRDGFRATGPTWIWRRLGLGSAGGRLPTSNMSKLAPQFRRRLVTYVILSGFLVLLAGGGFAAFESRQVSNYWEGVWWALSLMTTIGFVGEAPESVMGRVVSSVLMVSGFALMALVTAAIASLFVGQEQEHDEEVAEVFDAQALKLLAELAQRLAAIETTLTSGSPSDHHDATEPPTPTS
jgi:voltage-gated potassium channel